MPLDLLLRRWLVHGCRLCRAVSVDGLHLRGDDHMIAEVVGDSARRHASRSVTDC